MVKVKKILACTHERDKVRSERHRCIHTFRCPPIQSSAHPAV